MWVILKTPAIGATFALAILSISLGWGLPMIFHPSPHLGELIVGTGSAVSLALFYYVYILYKRQLKKQPLLREQNEKLREERVKHRQIYSDRVEIPNLLLKLHEYVIDEINKQQVPPEEAKLISRQLIKSTSKLTIILVLLSYILPRPFGDIIAKFYYSSIPTIIRNWNAIFSKYNLGMLVVEELEPYKALHKQITDYQVGLPPKIVAKIDECVTKSELFSSLILWDLLLRRVKMPRKVRSDLGLVLPYLPKSINRNMNKLCSEVSDEIEKFLLGE